MSSCPPGPQMLGIQYPNWGQATHTLTEATFLQQYRNNAMMHRVSPCRMVMQDPILVKCTSPLSIFLPTYCTGPPINTVGTAHAAHAFTPTSQSRQGGWAPYKTGLLPHQALAWDLQRIHESQLLLDTLTKKLCILAPCSFAVEEKTRACLHISKEVAATQRHDSHRERPKRWSENLRLAGGFCTNARKASGWMGLSKPYTTVHLQHHTGSGIFYTSPQFSTVTPPLFDPMQLQRQHHVYRVITKSKDAGHTWRQRIKSLYLINTEW